MAGGTSFPRNLTELLGDACPHDCYFLGSWPWLHHPDTTPTLSTACTAVLVTEISPIGPAQVGPTQLLS